MKPETLVAQAGHAIDAATGAIVPPIHLSTTYARADGYQLIDGRDYARDRNPTHLPAEHVIAELERGEDAMLFASGMAAATAALRAHLAPGAHVIIPRVAYFGVRAWMARFAARWGVEVSTVDATDVAQIAAALRPTTKLVWIETPANPTWAVTDIARVVDVARRVGARVAVDSTCGTPVYQRPLELGADLVMHSATKYLAGHSDVLAGALVTAKRDEVWAELHHMRREEGACLGPFEAALLLRGLRTLFVRVERQTQTARALVARLAALPGVTVLYPGFSGMLSIRVGGDGPARALAVIAQLRVWVRATSLGGVESLAEHRFSVEGAGTPTPADLIRLSVGLEHEDDLYDDLAQALGQVTAQVTE
ncbi:MAG: PLP-dependent aspartate aminotransferase family protein [Proteobacteria bacterium]|nr:PLP-dependent aspartate aminotransferase family protein [Pseudomonadota bacterium]